MSAAICCCVVRVWACAGSARDARQASAVAVMVRMESRVIASLSVWMLCGIAEENGTSRIAHCALAGQQQAARPFELALLKSCDCAHSEVPTQCSTDVDH